MRVALLADIHGNSLALEAVLADIEAWGGVDSYWILGDLCAIGYDPAKVLEQITALPNAIVIRGNVDRFVTTGERPYPSFEDAKENPDLIPRLAEVAGSFGWTQGYLSACGWLDWLDELPNEHRLTLTDGTRVLLTHASPGVDDDSGLHPALLDDEIEAKIRGCETDLMCVGHFHLAMTRRLNGIHMVSPGSVSNNFPPDLRAAYAILTATESGYDFSFYRVEYDRAAAIEKTRRSGNPGAAYIIRFLQRDVRAGWLSRWDGTSYSPPLSP
jgi:putative phosphoesterase